MLRFDRARRLVPGMGAADQIRFYAYRVFFFLVAYAPFFERSESTACDAHARRAPERARQCLQIIVEYEYHLVPYSRVPPCLQSQAGSSSSLARARCTRPSAPSAHRVVRAPAARTAIRPAARPRYETELARGVSECPFGPRRARAGAPCPAGAVYIKMPIHPKQSR